MACFVLSPSSTSLSLSSSSFTANRTLRKSPEPCIRTTIVTTPRRHRVSTSATLPTPPLLPLPPSPLTDALFANTTTQLLSDISEVNKGPLFATAFVFFLTFWGAISFVKGSTKDRITQASFNIREPASDIAKKTARYLMERSFVPDPTKDERKGVMTFTGEVRASTSVASILVAVSASGLWATTYILNFILPAAFQSDYWGLLTLLSFAIVPWYRGQANRTEYVKVMVEEEEEEDSDENLSVLFVKGHRDEIEQLEKNFKWKRNEPVYEDDKTATEKQPESVAS